MSRRTTVLASATTAVVTALVVGSATAPADAGSRTRVAKLVAGIAAKVVDQKAPTLSVQHADTADAATSADTAKTAGDATTLGGKPASAYASKVYAVALPQSAMAKAKKYTLPSLPGGTYTVAWDVYAVTTDPAATFSCDLDSNNPFQMIPDVVGTGSRNISVGSGMVTGGAANTPSLNCGVDKGGFQINPKNSAGSSIVLTRIDASQFLTATEADTVAMR
jgi:hypothetical protein